MRDAQPLKGAVNQLGLCCRSPDNIARPIAMAEAGTIENDDAIVPCGQINQTAGFEILDHAAVAVQQYQRRA